MALQEAPVCSPPRPEVADRPRPEAAGLRHPRVENRLHPEVVGRPHPEAAGRLRRRVVRKFPLAVPLVDVYPGSPPSPGTSPLPVPSVAQALAGRVAPLPYALLILWLHPVSR
jgi:hypothetical protein